MQFYTELLQAGTHTILIKLRHMKNAERVRNQEVGTCCKSSVVLIVKNHSLSHTTIHMQWVTLHNIHRWQNRGGERGGRGAPGACAPLEEILPHSAPPFKLLGVVNFVIAFAVTGSLN